jgi:hypothetical protein
VALCLFKNIIKLTVGQWIDNGGHRHAYFNLLNIKVAIDPAENAIIAVIEQGDAIGKIAVKTDGGKFELAVRNQCAASSNLMPLHIAAQAMATVRPWREKGRPARLASGDHHLSVFQMIDKTIDLGRLCKADRAEFSETDIFRFVGFAHIILHLLIAKNGHVAVDADAADVVHQSDLGILYLHFAGFAAQLQNNGSYLAAAGGADGMSL